MSDLPVRNVERSLGDGVYVSFDGRCIKLRAHSLAGQGDHIVVLERDVYRGLLNWVAEYAVLWEHFATARDDK